METSYSYNPGFSSGHSSSSPSLDVVLQTKPTYRPSISSDILAGNYEPRTSPLPLVSLGSSGYGVQGVRFDPPQQGFEYRVPIDYGWDRGAGWDFGSSSGGYGGFLTDEGQDSLGSDMTSFAPNPSENDWW